MSPEPNWRHSGEILREELLRPLGISINGLARAIDVPPNRLNEQVKRNPSRFPADFAFQITAQESADLKSQIATSRGGRDESYNERSLRRR